MRILNLTQHVATRDQFAAGVVEPAHKPEVQELLTFEELPSRAWILAKAQALAELARAHAADVVLIGGAPFFMAPLEAALKKVGIKPLYSFTLRTEAGEEPDGKGGMRKSHVFRHVGFIEV
jgi:hypothetical protein